MSRPLPCFLRRRPALAALVVAGALAAAGAACPSARAGEAVVNTAAGSFAVPGQSIREARFRGVIRQQRDFSCGSAALATLLTYHYARPTTEEEAFQAMFSVGDKALIQRQGFSLYDMQHYLAERGLSADGFRVSLDKLAEVGIPAVTLISLKGYNHFVVVKGVRDGKVLMGDPALGLKAVPRDEFEKMWSGVMFVIRDDMTTGRASFNRGEDWGTRNGAPVGSAMSRQGLATFSTMLPHLFEF